eukprot:CAMPEP_0119476792 /NCGR_PEP_ID=MMETSP1344-20130328/7177_1 /TAXON_ID=236787 /ORGANISM="Florenciella parvula, Strain CCMP2471" /LENGTH=48 /DNA_ID= /DNA_START= /DNA_END= /DNA_ORIENTATION=
MMDGILQPHTNVTTQSYRTKVTPMATGDAVEMQPMGTAVNRDTGGSSP